MLVKKNVLSLQVVFLFLLSLLMAPLSLFADEGECPCKAKEEKKAEEWERGLALGLNLTRGNSDTVLFHYLGTLSRWKKDNIWRFSINGNQGDSDSEKTQDNIKGELSYKRLLTKRFFFGTGVSALYDDIADIDYRVLSNISPGYFLLRDDSLKLSVEAGPAYLFEESGDEPEDYLAVRAANRLKWKISPTAKIFQAFEYLVSMEDSSVYIITGEVGVEASLTTMLSLVVSLKDHYINVPAEDKEQNDLAVVSALKVSY